MTELRDQMAEALRQYGITSELEVSEISLYAAAKVQPMIDRAECRATEAMAEAEQLRAKVAEYENAITWDTRCLSCAAVLDSSVKETERAERAEARLKQAETLRDKWLTWPESDPHYAAGLMLATWLDKPSALNPAGGSEEKEDPKAWCKCDSCWAWFVEEHPGEDLDNLGRDRSWWSGLPVHRDPPPGVEVAALRPGEPPRTITTVHLPEDR